MSFGQEGTDITITLPEELAEEANEIAKSAGFTTVKDMLIAHLKRQVISYRTSKFQKQQDDLERIK